jgi:hypothetical protein
MKIDTSFVGRLLPNHQNHYSWLRVVMDKWEKSYPGTMKELLKLTERKKFSKKFINISSISFFGIFLVTFWLALALDNTHWIPISVGGFSIALTVFLTNLISDNILSVKKDDRVQKLQELLDEIDKIFRSSCAFNEITDRQAYLTIHQMYQRYTFEDLKSVCEQKALGFANVVLNCECQLHTYLGDDVLSNALNHARIEMNRFHRMFSQVGLLHPDLGKYYASARGINPSELGDPDIEE